MNIGPSTTQMLSELDANSRDDQMDAAVTVAITRASSATPMQHDLRMLRAAALIGMEHYVVSRMCAWQPANNIVLCGKPVYLSALSARILPFLWIKAPTTHVAKRKRR